VFLLPLTFRAHIRSPKRPGWDVEWLDILCPFHDSMS
jgi:hypothetical protein